MNERAIQRHQPSPTLEVENLVLGVDGGGTKTLAWLARHDQQESKPIGRGIAGSSNPQAVGLEQAGANVLQAVQAAFQSAGLQSAPVTSACLALAGVGREPIRQAMLTWCREQPLADRVQVVHDAMAVLAAGTTAGWGVALIAGTGSFAFATSPTGTWKRTGGWGYLFGDEGSGFFLGLAALRAISSAVDGRGPATQLTNRVLDHFQLDEPAELIPLLCRPQPPREQIASLAELVFQTADQEDPRRDPDSRASGQRPSRLGHRCRS